jgi:hypothetical protein
MMDTVEDLIKELSKYPPATKVIIDTNNNYLIEWVSYIDNSNYDKSLSPVVSINVVDVSED